MADYEQTGPENFTGEARTVLREGAARQLADLRAQETGQAEPADTEDTDPHPSDPETEPQPAGADPVPTPDVPDPEPDPDPDPPAAS